MKKKKFSKTKTGFSDDLPTNKTSIFNKKNIGLFVVSGIVLIMIISIFTISLGNPAAVENLAEYNGFKLKNINGLWNIKINNIDYVFEYSPNDLQSVDSAGLDLGNKVYISYDTGGFSYDSPELLRLKQFLALTGRTAFFACLKEDGCGNFPLIDCSNVNKVIYFTNGNKTQMYNDNNCIILEAVPGEESLIINKFMYLVLGVIRNG
ncbi:hypothetical protein HYU23_03010 [Candidatus Woesearchaeota archaeon]|nr:hypothetical protein [Candidatus Woesearchaeota archaeon]